jgi:hypothetical protein
VGATDTSLICASTWASYYSREAAFSFPATRLPVEAIPWGGGAPAARPGIWIGRGARRRWFDLRRPGRRVDRRSAGHRADHPRPWRSCAPDVPRGRTERGAGTGEGTEAATAGCRTAAASALPLAATARLRIGPAAVVDRLFSRRLSHNLRRARWIGSEGGLRKPASRPSGADRPLRRRRARLLWRALPRARTSFPKRLYATPSAQGSSASRSRSGLP